MLDCDRFIVQHCVPQFPGIACVAAACELLENVQRHSMFVKIGFEHALRHLLGPQQDNLADNCLGLTLDNVDLARNITGLLPDLPGLEAQEN